MKTSYRKLARAAKRAGLVNWDLRHSLTPGKKAWLTKLQNAHRELASLANHYAEYNSVRITAQAAKSLANRGHIIRVTPTKKTSLLIRNEGFGRPKFDSKNNTVTIRHEFYTEQLFVPKRNELLGNVFERLSKKKLGPNESLTIRIGTHRPIYRSFGSGALLQQYAQDMLNGMSNDQRSYILQHAAIVTIHDGEIHEKNSGNRSRNRPVSVRKNTLTIRRRIRNRQ